MSLTLKRPVSVDVEPEKPGTASPGAKSKSKSKAKANVPAAKDSRNRVHESLVVGGEPRVDLLPPEVRAQRKAKSIRRGLGFAILGVVVVIVCAVGGAAALALNSQTTLLAAQAETGSILAQQKQFVQVRQVQDQVQLAQAAQQVGASTEIDWQAYLTKVQATLPANVTIDTVTVDSASPIALFEQSTAPLQGARVATISFAAKSPTLPAVPDWLDALASLPGFADAVPGSVTLDTTTNVYTVNITMHINDAAYDHRFGPKEK